MNRFRVRIAARAQHQLARALAWWRENRRAAPNLLLDEVTEALELLATAPRVGILYAYRGRARSVRRVFLPRVNYHLYYTVDEAAGVATVRVLWQATRGRGPAL